MVDDALPISNAASTGDSTEITVADIPIVATSIDEDGAGTKTQYLTEKTVGGSGTGTGAETGDTGETPPISVTITGLAGATTWEKLKALRDRNKTFTIETGGRTYEHMELSELKRTASGEHPASYGVTLSCQEYREVSVEELYPQPATPQDQGTDSGPGGGGGGGGTGPVKRWVDKAPKDGVDDRTGVQIPPVKTVNGARVRLGGGQAFERRLINETPNTRILARGDGWAIRNIGVNGSRSNSDPFLNVSGNGIIENCYFGDGGSGAAPAVFIHAAHSGVIRIRNCYFGNVNSHAVYGSAPGNRPPHPNPGGQGIYHVEDCYVRNSVTGFRTGTNGCTIRNSVMDVADISPPVNRTGTGRAIWAYSDTVDVYNCDINGRLVLGGGHWPYQRTGQIRLHNTRFRGSIDNNGRGVSGQSQGAPNLSVPASVPKSAREAANGLFTTPPPTP